MAAANANWAVDSFNVAFAGKIAQRNRTVGGAGREFAVEVVGGERAVGSFEVHDGAARRTDEEEYAPTVAMARAGSGNFATLNRDMNLGENDFGLALRRLGELTGGDGIGGLVPALELNAAVGFGVDAKGGRFGASEGFFLGLNQGALVIEGNVKVGAVVGGTSVVAGPPSCVNV